MEGKVGWWPRGLQTLHAGFSFSYRFRCDDGRQGPSVKEDWLLPPVKNLSRYRYSLRYLARVRELIRNIPGKSLPFSSHPALYDSTTPIMALLKPSVPESTAELMSLIGCIGPSLSLSCKYKKVSHRTVNLLVLTCMHDDHPLFCGH